MTWISVACDVCGVTMGEGVATKEAANKRAVNSGWSVRDGLHFCHEHLNSEPVKEVQERIKDQHGREVVEALNASA